MSDSSGDQRPKELTTFKKRNFKNRGVRKQRPSSSEGKDNLFANAL